jgi:hypothetical protein
MPRAGPPRWSGAGAIPEGPRPGLGLVLDALSRLPGRKGLTVPASCVKRVRAPGGAFDLKLSVERKGRSARRS